FVGLHIAPFRGDGVRVFNISGDPPVAENIQVPIWAGSFNLLTSGAKGGPKGDSKGDPVIETGHDDGKTHRFHIVKADRVEQVGEAWPPGAGGCPRPGEAASEILYISDANKLMRVPTREGKPAPAEAVDVPLKETSRLVAVSSDGHRIALDPTGESENKAVGP